MNPDRPLHLLIYGLNYAPEQVGVGKYTAELAQWLAGRGHRVTVVTAPPHYPQWRIGEGFSGRRFSRRFECGVEVIRCPIWMPRRLNATQRILCALSFSLSSLVPLLMRARSANVLLVIEPTFFAAPAVALLGPLMRRPTWLHVQDFELAAALGSGYFVRAGRLMRWMAVAESWLRRRFDRVSTLGPQMDWRLAVAGVPEKRRAILPNWVDCSAIHPLERSSSFRARLSIPEDAIVALYSGTFGRKHGLDLLIEVARILEGRNQLHFVFCGEGSERAVLQSAAEGLGNISWLPLQPFDELNELLNLADIHLLPQLAEVASAVLPSKLTGMLASGRPVVATAAPGTELADCVSGAGIVAESRDASSFARALLLLADDTELRRRLGSAGRTYALRFFDKQTVLERHEAVFMALASAGDSPDRKRA